MRARGASIRGPEYPRAASRSRAEVRSSLILHAKLALSDAFRLRSGSALPHSQIPAGSNKLMRGAHDYNFHTVEQKHAKGKKKYWPRGAFLVSSFIVVI